MGALTSIVLGAVGLLVFYFVTRAAVKGGILDADRVRARETHGTSTSDHPAPE
ncbi:hypothetical protein [Georgenia subflava]|uniref:hypothetical protein n=1 Tax=Georgenia subflava TaxID=1622177 RepID=UPI00186AD18B|nr:hypothetical protein [Georgenia subflava]